MSKELGAVQQDVQCCTPGLEAAHASTIRRMIDQRVLPVFKRIMAGEDDRKLRLHAEHGLKRYADAGLRA